MTRSQTPEKTSQPTAGTSKSLIDDKELALSEARRMEEGRRYPAVRVVEERYDADAGGYRSRTVYRSSAMDADNEAALKERAQVRREVQEHRQARSAAATRQTNTARPASLGAIYALNQLAGS